MPSMADELLTVPFLDVSLSLTLEKTRQSLLRSLAVVKTLIGSMKIGSTFVVTSDSTAL